MIACPAKYTIEKGGVRVELMQNFQVKLTKETNK